jgi:hypothetical protein
MVDRNSLVEKLVSTLHLNVAERKILVSMPVQKSEILSAVKRLLDNSGRFPPNARLWHQGQNVFEGHFLELLPNGTVRLWWQRHHATNPSQLAEQKHWDFADIGLGVEEFVTKEWADAQIDGIRILPDNSR